MGQAIYLYIILPVAFILLALKCCLLFWRIHYYQQRRRQQLIRQQQMQRNAIIRANQARAYARLSNGAQGGGLTRITARSNDGTQQVFIVPTALLSQRIGEGGSPSQRPHRSDSEAGIITLTPEDLLLGATGRRFDPNMPPSYHQAVTGQDRSVKVEEGMSDKTIGMADGGESQDYPPPPEYSPNDTSDTAHLLP